MKITNRRHRLMQCTLMTEISKDTETISTKLSKLEQDLAERLAIKSGACWLEEGECSSSYFFSRFSQRLQLAKIPDLVVDGNTITDAKGKAEARKNHLQSQWERRDVEAPTNFSWHCPKLSPTQTQSLIQPITLEEVMNAISH